MNLPRARRNLGVKLPAPVGVFRLKTPRDLNNGGVLSLFSDARGSLRIGRYAAARPSPCSEMKHTIVHVALVVRDYDEAIAFYTEQLGFTLVEDTYQPEQDKRWVVVAPAGSRGT